MDAFSRYVSLQIQTKATAEQTLKSYEIALKKDFGVNRYDRFVSDRGRLIARSVFFLNDLIGLQQFFFRSEGLRQVFLQT